MSDEVKKEPQFVILESETRDALVDALGKVWQPVGSLASETIRATILALKAAPIQTEKTEAP